MNSLKHENSFELTATFFNILNFSPVKNTEDDATLDNKEACGFLNNLCISLSFLHGAVDAALDML